MSDEQLDLDEAGKHLIGMALDKARDLSGNSGWIVRCVNADGKARVVTRDVMPNRINVHTVDGLITGVQSVG